MHWDAIKDYATSFIGTIVLILSLIFIPEIRRSKKMWMPVIGLVIIQFLLGLDKVYRDNKRDTEYYGNINSLTKNSDILKRNADTLKKVIANNSFQTNQFLKRLDSSFHITRDPTSNQPVKTVFNTYIGEARDVSIGRN